MLTCYAFDPVIQFPKFGVPRQVSVVTNLSIDYISPAMNGQSVNITAKIVKLSKKSALTEVIMYDPQSSKIICRGNISRAWIKDDYVVSKKVK